MSEAVWRSSLALSAVLLLAVIFETYLLVNSRYSTKPVLEVLGTPQLPWAFNTSRDSHNIALTHEQCQQAFPDLYYEIDRSVSYWKDENHVINSDDIDIKWREDGGLRLLIYNNELRIVETKAAWAPHYRFSKRTISVLNMIRDALLGATAIGEQIPNIEFSVVVSDRAEIPRRDHYSVWAFDRKIGNKKEEKLWMMPDWQFFAAPPYAGSFSEMRSKAISHDKPLSEKIPKAVWRGRPRTRPKVRMGLIETAEGKDWADVMKASPTDEEDERNVVISMDNLCQYMFLLHTEGVTWSGRLKFILNCDSVPIIHKLEYTTSYYHLLKHEGPEQNHIQVERDWSDLESKVQYYLNHPDEAQRIADNAKETFRSRNTSPAAGACYLRRMMHRYNEVAFKTEPFETVDVSVSGRVQKQHQLRGWSMEHFLFYDVEKELGWGFEDVPGAG